MTFDCISAEGPLAGRHWVIQARVRVLCQKTFAVVALQLLLLVSGPVPKGSPAELTLMRVGYGGIAGYQVPLWVGKELGISRKYGIDFEPLLIGGGS